MECADSDPATSAIHIDIYSLRRVNLCCKNIILLHDVYGIGISCLCEPALTSMVENSAPEYLSSVQTIKLWRWNSSRSVPYDLSYRLVMYPKTLSIDSIWLLLLINSASTICAVIWITVLHVVTENALRHFHTLGFPNSLTLSLIRIKCPWKLKTSDYEFLFDGTDDNMV